MGVRVIEGSNYRGLNYSEFMTEIQGKSILVRVSARFELARVRVIGSQLHLLLILCFTQFGGSSHSLTFSIAVFSPGFSLGESQGPSVKK